MFCLNSELEAIHPLIVGSEFRQSVAREMSYSVNWKEASHQKCGSFECLPAHLTYVLY